ncbi:olfactory receptor 5AR1-like [Pleurodeles waltl]|uniref:olfactory receptor 5AR1-like n=1 Tax=Pleurodeles waltl TaxID=8319 RepID=UPI003709BE07
MSGGKGMDNENQTLVMYFIFQGLSDNPKHQTAFFVLFVTIYIVGIVSNCAIIAAIATDSRLHTPMYFFIWSLSLVDICILTAIVPQLLVSTISQRKTISYSRCIAQLYVFVGMETIDSLLLGAMAYDRYVAICRPLHYFTAMDKKVCTLLLAGSWVGGFLNSLLYSTMIVTLSFCAANVIQSFFCDVPPLLKLSCSDTSVIEVLIFTVGTFIGLVSIAPIVMSYTRIISTVLSIRSNKERSKTFSTCSSHLIVVTLYYGTIVCTEFRPSSSYTLQRDKVVTVMYTIVPMLNPFIYSLRSEQMKQALKKMMGKCTFFCKF